MGWLILLGLLGMLAAPAWADVDIQYELSSGNVTGARTAPPSIESVDNYGIVTLTGVSLDEMIWPIPSGCVTGKPEWSRITDAENVTVAGGGMAVRSGLLFFTTTSTLVPECHLIKNKGQLTALVNKVIIDALNASNPLGESMSRVETRNAKVCPNENDKCAAAHSKLNTIRNVQSTDDDDFDDLLAQIQTLKTDYDAFVGTNFP